MSAELELTNGMLVGDVDGKVVLDLSRKPAPKAIIKTLMKFAREKGWIIADLNDYATLEKNKEFFIDLLEYLDKHGYDIVRKK